MENAVSALSCLWLVQLARWLEDGLGWAFIIYHFSFSEAADRQSTPADSTGVGCPLNRRGRVGWIRSELCIVSARRCFFGFALPHIVVIRFGEGGKRDEERWLRALHGYAWHAPAGWTVVPTVD
ncbi:hypothetical protein BS50DRAFT_576631 [Corynespora cassiicola Philippines]|uniref:Secreted protein n=1 Tax=Corynespora cassiicola Philippines TaxID=1448308 RepID=A0A2T2NEY3_CORCC|nr:hypothetical protein BS50DRAFT_576631 [Corynespora cassiicola Philippines]